MFTPAVILLLSAVAIAPLFTLMVALTISDHCHRRYNRRSHT